MKLKIVWTLQAVKGLESVIEYLEAEWTSKEIYNLELKLKELLERISSYPKICPATIKHKNVRKGLVDKNNYIIYRINFDKRVIELINFRGTRQKPLE